MNFEQTFGKIARLSEAKRLQTSDPTFMRLFKEHYVDGIYGLKKLDGFPKGLDLENCDVIFVGSDYVQIQAGGDWQQGINFSFIVDGKTPRIVGLYENGPGRGHAREVNAYLKACKEL